MVMAIVNLAKAVAVVVKIALGRYVKSVGEKVRSDSLVNSGEDATLDSIRQAIRRAEKIVEQNGKDGKASENYRGFTFYHDNPDVSVHEVVQLIFEVCEV